ncbi:MAG TPA: MBL fold metallo-hydrolase [Verrucomicrobiae bacterium]|nr:MBL fold metallo-hydrolase [Verrucomicrobiae bacterium]
MQRNRRKFVTALGGMVAGSACAAYWGATSQRRAARWMRTIVADARRAILPVPVKPTPGNWSDNKVTIAWLGHATVLINFFGVRILTDPALFSRIGIRTGFGIAGPKRYVACALKPQELPPIDLILLSHAHLDHMDLSSLAKVNAPILTAKDTRDILPSRRRVTELGWDERTTLNFKNGDLEIRAIEVKHWGQRWPSERERGYNGYVLQRGGRSILFGGDTADTRLDLRGPYDAAIMPIGAYDPWIHNHCTPEQALAMVNAVRANYIIPVHHQTYRLSNEPMMEPIERLTAALSTEPERLAIRRIGETCQI